MRDVIVPTAVTDEDGLRSFLTVRPRLFGVAYRILGSTAEAEDIVQDVWVRWQTTDRRPVKNPAAFLVTATTRLAINVLQSARARRETSVGEWLHEPIDVCADPTLPADRAEALNRAVTFLLEKLKPTERAAYVLREAFGYPYREIAGVLRVGEANARQLVTRARERLRATQPSRHNVSPYPVNGYASRFANKKSDQGGKEHRYETRHHRGYRTHRLEAGEHAGGTRT